MTPIKDVICGHSKKSHTKKKSANLTRQNEQRMRESKCIELYRLAGRTEKKCEKNYTITEIKSGDDDDC